MLFRSIANANTEKRERLITDEVEANNQLVQLGAAVMMSARHDACQQINQMYGLQVSVRQRTFAEVSAMLEGSDMGGALDG